VKIKAGGVEISSNSKLGIAGSGNCVHAEPKSIKGFSKEVETMLKNGTFGKRKVSTKGFIGVFKNKEDPDKFEAKIYVNNGYEYLGVFASKEEAAAAYDVVGFSMRVCWVRGRERRVPGRERERERDIDREIERSGKGVSEIVWYCAVVRVHA
jgi:hypothetical protein